jgi:hypothetical protein
VAGCQWLTPVILAIQKAERSRGWQFFKASPGKQFVRPYLEQNPSQKMVVVGPEFKAQYQTQRQRERERERKNVEQCA